MNPARFFFSEKLLEYDMGPGHPLKPIRLEMTYALLESYGLFEEALEKVEPKLASDEEVCLSHSAEYLDVLRRLERGEPVADVYRYGLNTPDNPLFPRIYTASMRYTGASIGAAQAVIEAKSQEGQPVAFNLSGGLHHAHYSRASGFCVLNDCAVGIRRLLRGFSRVAYVDIDVHHGDGVQESFYRDPNVLTISIHESGRTLFPGTGFPEEIGEGAGLGTSVNIPLAPNTPDEVWLWAWREVAIPILEAYHPDAIFLQMGTDAHAYDPLAHVCLSAQGWLQAVKDVKALGKPIVAVGGGGYNLTTVPRMWTLAVATLIGKEIADTTPQSYAYHESIPQLTDPIEPAVSDAERQAAWAFAKRTVQQVKSLLFPYYGLGKSSIN